MGLNNYDILLKEIEDNVVLVTGATGLIGQALVKRLVEHNVYVIAVVRDENKAKSIFHNDKRISYIVSDITELKNLDIKLDYIIHAASMTSSKSFVDNPVDVIYTSIEGTRRTLEIAKDNNIKGFIYLSSMEIYGTPCTDEKIDENYSSNLNTMEVRSSYPESKRLCENLCASYVSQYNVPAKVIRLAQTFGPGVSKDDHRVYAEFAKCVIEKRDIMLHTKGDTKRCYLYTEDAVDAIITILLRGDVGEAYNAANEDTYCSIYEMAVLVSKMFNESGVKVIINEAEECRLGYAPTLRLNLDTNKLRSLNWKPSKGLKEMFESMVLDLKNRFY